MSIPKIADYAMPARATFPANRTAWRPAPARAVLLIHDMQRYFLRFYDAEGALLRALIGNLARLRAWARASGVPVIYTAQPYDQPAGDRALLNDMWGPGLAAAEPDLQAIVPELAPGPGDVVLTKWRYSAFQRSDLLERMRGWGRDQIVIGGVYGHIGCMVTAVEAFMNDVQPFLVGDAVADFSEEEHRWALRYVATRCGALVATEDFAKGDLAAEDAVAKVTDAAVERPAAGGAVIEVLVAGPPAAGDPAHPAPTREWLEERVAKLVEDEAPLDPDENLIFYGLDSIQVMRLAAELRERGVEVGFDDLARVPTLNGWWSLIERRRLAA